MIIFATNQQEENGQTACIVQAATSGAYLFRRLIMLITADTNDVCLTINTAMVGTLTAGRFQTISWNN